MGRRLQSAGQHRRGMPRRRKQSALRPSEARKQRWQRGARRRRTLNTKPCARRKRSRPPPRLALRLSGSAKRRSARKKAQKEKAQKEKKAKQVKRELSNKEEKASKAAAKRRAAQERHAKETKAKRAEAERGQKAKVAERREKEKDTKYKAMREKEKKQTAAKARAALERKRKEKERKEDAAKKVQKERAQKEKKAKQVKRELSNKEEKASKAAAKRRAAQERHAKQPWHWPHGFVQRCGRQRLGGNAPLPKEPCLVDGKPTSPRLVWANGTHYDDGNLTKACGWVCRCPKHDKNGRPLCKDTGNSTKTRH